MAWNKFVVLFAALSCVVLFSAEGQVQSPFSFQVVPCVTVPVGDSTSYFGVGGSAVFSAEYAPPAVQLLLARAELGYTVAPSIAGQLAHLVSLGAGAGVKLSPLPWLTLKLFAAGGYYQAIMVSASGDVVSGGDPFVSAGTSAMFALGPSLSLGLGATFKSYLLFENTVEGFIAVSLTPKARSSTLQQGVPLRPDLLEIGSVEWESVFPVFRKYFDDHPIGSIAIRNGGKVPLSEVSATLFIRQYMDAAKETRIPGEIKPGETRTVDLFALLTESVLDVTEATKVSVEIGVEATAEGQRARNQKVETLRVYDRNAMTWDDDRRPAAFVTSKDPQVLTFSNNVTGVVKEEGAVSQNLRLGMALHEALRLHGMSYRRDPRTPYDQLSALKQEVDFLQFPRQSLEYRAGDCDDLSILYCALLESLGVETAFITVPGHIFMAFSLDMTQEEARKGFSKTDDVIFRGDKSWIPVEVTLLSEDFLQAWQRAAAEWRQYLPREQAGFYPVHEAWKLYEPVGLPAGGLSITPPLREAISASYTAVVGRYVDRELSARVSVLEAEVTRTQGSARAINALGVLYARYELWDKAQREFQRVVDQEEYPPALMNMGNIHLLKDEPLKALALYERARAKDQSSPLALLAVARANNELERYDVVKVAYAELKRVAPALAEQHAYLEQQADGGARASGGGSKGKAPVWAED